MMTNDLSFGSVKRLIGRAPNPNVGSHMSADQCVQATTAFRSVADMMDTQLSYAPKFWISRRAATDAERAAMLTAARAFNHHAEQAGQSRRAWIF
jgi:hypothetical protein